MSSEADVVLGVMLVAFELQRLPGRLVHTRPQEADLTPPPELGSKALPDRARFLFECFGRPARYEAVDAATGPELVMLGEALTELVEAKLQTRRLAEILGVGRAM